MASQTQTVAFWLYVEAPGPSQCESWSKLPSVQDVRRMDGRDGKKGKKEGLELEGLVVGGWWIGIALALKVGNAMGMAGLTHSLTHSLSRGLVSSRLVWSRHGAARRGAAPESGSCARLAACSQQGVGVAPAPLLASLSETLTLSLSLASLSLSLSLSSCLVSSVRSSDRVRPDQSVPHSVPHSLCSLAL